MKKIIAVVFLCLLFACSNPTRFERLSADDTGIDFNNEVVEKDSFNILHDEYMYNGGGVGVADLNNDGLPDLIFTGNKVSTKVYLNQGEFEFQDVTSRFDGLTNDQWYSGVAVVDINNDGWQDVYLTSTSSKDPDKRVNRLWVNQGKSSDGKISFKEMAEDFGIADRNYTVQAGFFDYDLDGDLDLYILNNIVNKSVPTNYRPKIVDGSSVNNDKLYRNEGNGKFTDVTIDAGIVYEGFGLGLAFGDVNKDGFPDIYVSNDYISNDILYINQGNGTFKNASKEYLSYQSRFSMGNEMVDINNDGNLDIMSVDMMPEQYFRKKQTINGNSYFVYMNNAKYSYEPQFVRNMLHLHNGFKDGKMLPFSEVGQMLGIFQTEWSWSPLFADYDNDGDRDLLLTNGFPKDLTDKDFTNYKAQVYGFVADDKHMITRIPVVKVPNYAFENTGPYSFKDQTEAWGLNMPSFSNGAAFVDLDNDGDLDYVVNNINDEAFIYRNNTIGKLGEKKNYLKLKLTGAGNNVMAIGAKVELWTHGRLQYYEHFLTRGYISSVDPVVHLGLDSVSTVDSLRVTWPSSGKISMMKDIGVNQLLSLKEDEGVLFAQQKPAPPADYLFEKTNGILDFVHTEEDYVDFFQNQRILQHKFSQAGPCLAQGDINRDGLEDIVIGGSKDSPTSVFINHGGSFKLTEIDGLSTKKHCTEADMVVFDVDLDGDNDLISISGGYENENESSYEHFLYRNNGKGFEKETLPIGPFVGSVVRAFDFDHDGDKDLFVGARVKRAMFPNAPPSYIIRNEAGAFSDPLSFDLGMVTDAVWSDYDGDGWEDLLIAREWSSLTILKSVGGKTFAESKVEKLMEKNGFWSGISAADLDKDGDDDYIAGNLGKNHRFTISETFPMRLYAIDIDKNGFIDPLVTSYWKDAKGIMQEYPVNYLDELVAQSPLFRKKFTSYTKFSYAVTDSIINRSEIPAGNRYTVNATSSYILWNDKGDFRWEELPPVVQTAPLKKILVTDFNSDGWPDMVLAGNDHTYDVSTGYYDAGKGVVLVGKPGGSFEVLTAARSGLLLDGQVTSLLLVKGNPNRVIAGINRDSVLVYQYKGSAAGGL